MKSPRTTYNLKIAKGKQTPRDLKYAIESRT